MNFKKFLTEAVIDDVRQLVDRTGAEIRFPKSAWYEDENMKCYVRFQRGRHLRIEGQAVQLTALTVANVHVNDDKQKKGIYSKFLADIETLPGIQCIIIENILEAEQLPLYQRRGYKRLEIPGDMSPSPSYYKLL